MLSTSQQPLTGIVDISGPDSIFEIANELRVRRIGQSFRRTIYSKQFLQDLKTEISQKLKNPHLKEWVRRKIVDIALDEHTSSFKEYENDLEGRFSPDQKDIVKEIKENAKLSFIQADYTIRNNLKSYLEEWLKGVLENKHFRL